MMVFGPCCACDDDKSDADNVIALPFEGPDGFVGGWGCPVCYIPKVGALAVRCDACHALNVEVKRICGGTRLHDAVRIAIAGFEQKPLACDQAIHARYERMNFINRGGRVS